MIKTLLALGFTSACVLSAERMDLCTSLTAAKSQEMTAALAAR